MKLKICGMKFSDNIREVAFYEPDFIGFICYPGSSRYVDLLSIEKELKALKPKTMKVGVFVNQPILEVITICKRYGLEYAQLHGHESPEYVADVQRSGIQTIKAFSIAKGFDWTVTKAYETHSQFFLFDTATPEHGGSGEKFDWRLLNSYQGDRSFLLSGGIGEGDIAAIQGLQLPLLLGIDVNSRLEIKPGLKDINRVQNFLNEMSYE